MLKYWCVCVCFCYANKVHDEGNKYVEKATHFHSKCKEKHFLYILFCDKHLPSVPLLSVATKCAYVNKDVLAVCIHVKYLLNFKAHEFCLKQVPLPAWLTTSLPVYAKSYLFKKPPVCIFFLRAWTFLVLFCFLFRRYLVLKV